MVEKRENTETEEKKEREEETLKVCREDDCWIFNEKVWKTTAHLPD